MSKSVYEMVTDRIIEQLGKDVFPGNVHGQAYKVTHII